MDMHELALFAEITASSSACAMHHLDGHLLWHLCHQTTICLDASCSELLNTRARATSIVILIIMLVVSRGDNRVMNQFLVVYILVLAADMTAQIFCVVIPLVVLIKLRSRALIRTVPLLRLIVIR